MPSETREQILRELVGDKLIHIAWIGDCWATHEPKRQERIGLKRPREPGTFTHHLCRNEINEKQLRDDTRSGNIEVPPGEDPEYYIPPSLGRHDDCFQDSPDVKRSLDLNILGASRQLYEEANVILWTTNTFSFEWGVSLGKFFESLNAAQKRKIAKLHFTTSINCYEYYPYTRSATHQWDMAIKPHLKYLTNLTTLNLSLQLYWGSIPNNESNLRRYGRYRNYDPGEADYEWSVVRRWWLLFRTRGFLSLRSLPSLKEANVVISDDSEWCKNPRYIPPHGMQPQRWTTSEKNAFADEYEAKLKDHDPLTIELEVAAMLARHKAMHERYANQTMDWMNIKLVHLEGNARKTGKDLIEALKLNNTELEERQEEHDQAMQDLQEHRDKMQDRKSRMRTYRETLVVDIWGNENGRRGDTTDAIDDLYAMG